MTTYFVSRHPGAREWLETRQVVVDHYVLHLQDVHLHSGDRVLGTLPLQLACWVCEQGAEYWHLSLSIPTEWRGKELTAQQMEACQARLERFFITRVMDDGGM